MIKIAAMRRARPVTTIAFCLGLMALPAPSMAQRKTRELTTISLEDLSRMEISVSSFARKEENLWQTPAAVFVITREDIAHSSVSSIPELLRSVPGLQVAQIDASSWAVSARGFNSAYSAKLLVLIDGRTVYSEVYSGAHWDQIDPPIETIERIEVIRGPGAAVWGANAANGVINIITRAAHKTTGPLVSGHESRIDDKLTLGYAGSFGDKVQYRGFVSYVDRKPFVLQSGAAAFDGEGVWRAGGRMDWQPGKADSVATSGDIYAGHLRSQLSPQIALSVGPLGWEYESLAGGYLLSRWQHKTAHAESALQGYFDRQTRHEIGANVTTLTGDLDFQSHRAIGERNDVVWGAEARVTDDHIDGNVLLVAKPQYTEYLVNVFAQDEITLSPRKLVVTLGSKVEQGSLAGFQIQPSARVMWAPGSKQVLWAAVSRAAVAPSLQDTQSQIPAALGTLAGLPLTGILTGNPDFKPETVISFEGGYRRRLGHALVLDVAAFATDNGRLQSISIGTPVLVTAPAPHFNAQLLYVNGYSARTQGTETSLSWKPREALSLTAGYTWMQARTLQTWPGTVHILDAWNSPRNSVTASATWKFASGWSANGTLEHVGALALPISGGGAPVPAYTRLDGNVRWRLAHGFLITAGGTNLLTPRHLEFGTGTGFVAPAFVPRSLFVRGSWSF